MNNSENTVSITQNALTSSLVVGLGVFAFGICALFVSGSAQGSAKANVSTGSDSICWIEASMIPKTAPAMQRSAPATWSSRINVRLEARWGNDGRFMV